MNKSSGYMQLASSPRDSVVLIAGPVEGAAQAVARRFADYGATVIAAARSDNLPDHARYDLMAFDTANADEWELATGKIGSKYGGIDVLVNVAGSSVVGAAADMTLEQWQRHLATSFTSVFLGLKAAPILMGGRSNPLVVNVTTSTGLRGMPGASAEAASSAGVMSLTRSASLEFAQHGLGIRVNAICSGPRKSGWLVREITHADQFDQPEGIADLAVFLASEQARGINGACLIVDGGLSA